MSNVIGLEIPAVVGGTMLQASAGVPPGSAFFAWRARWPLMSLLLVGLTLLGAGMLGVPSLRAYDMIVACVVVNHFGSGILLPTLLTRVFDTMPPTLRGRGSGAWMSCLFLGQFVSPLVVLAVAGLLAGRLQAIACLALLSLATAALVPLMGLD